MVRGAVVLLELRLAALSRAVRISRHLDRRVGSPGPRYFARFARRNRFLTRKERNLDKDTEER